MLKIGVNDLESIFKNTKIRFRQEKKQSDEKYLDILLDEIQRYFNRLNTFEFDDKVFITQDKILSLKKYLYTLNIISDNLDTLYSKNDEIINEINKLFNINIYERDTIISKLDKIHNFMLSHTISSEQNADYTIFFRENFNDNSKEDKSAGSKGAEVDSFAGILKLSSIKKTVNIIDKNNVNVTLENKEEINGKIFPITEEKTNFSIGDLHDIDNGEYYEQNESTLRNGLIDTIETTEGIIEGNPLTACPFEIIFTNINDNGKDIEIIKSEIKKQTNIEGKIELKRDCSFLPTFLNNENEIPNLPNPEISFNFKINHPTLCSFVDIKFDGEIPSIIKNNGYIKGKVYDNKGKSYNIINLDIKDNKANLVYRIYWGKLISLKSLEIFFRTIWKDVSINLIKWESVLLNSKQDKLLQNVRIKKILFTEKFDSKIYYRETGENLKYSTLKDKLSQLIKDEHG